MIGLIRAKNTAIISIELDTVSNIITFETTTCAAVRHARRKIENNFMMSQFKYVSTSTIVIFKW